MFIEIDEIEENGDIKTLIINTDKISEVVKHSCTEGCFLYRGALATIETLDTYEEIKHKLEVKS